MLTLSRELIAIMGVIASAGIAWGITRATLQRALIDINSLADKIREAEQKMTLHDGRSTYVFRSDCDASRQEICNRHMQLEAKMDEVIRAQAIGTDKIIEAIREMHRG